MRLYEIFNRSMHATTPQHNSYYRSIALAKDEAAIEAEHKRCGKTVDCPWPVDAIYPISGEGEYVECHLHEDVIADAYIDIADAMLSEEEYYNLLAQRGWVDPKTIQYKSVRRLELYQ